MATVILVRHGRSTANASGVLAGRTAGVALDATGRAQAQRVAQRLADVPLAAVVTSPLQRCRETARALLVGREDVPVPVVEPRLVETDYGQWQGRPLAELAKEELWATVQTRPSAMRFPGGETMAGMQARGVAAIREHDARVSASHGDGAVWVAVSHGDLIASILADALGMHLDLFQRLDVMPASVSVVRHAGAYTRVLTTNSDGGDLSWLRAAQPDVGQVGGRTGPQRS